MPATRSAPADRSSVLPPPLKWAGGKRWQVPHLQIIWQRHAHRRLVEPFCGGLSVALGLSPARALLNDANPHLINFYRCLQQGLVTMIAMRNDENLYKRHRARFNRLLRSQRAEGPEAAAIFYFLNRTGYNGLCRFNKQGGFNVPFGRYATISYRRDFTAYAPRLAGWQFSAGDFAQLHLDRDDFVYADPPYDVDFTAYSQGGFSWNDQERVAVSLAAHPGPVVLVNQATPRVEALYRALGFALTYLTAPRRISANGDRTPAREVLATRNVD